MKCRRLGCDQAATHMLRPQYGRDFPVCAEHGPPWLATVNWFANRQSDAATLVAL